MFGRCMFRAKNFSLGTAHFGLALGIGFATYTLVNPFFQNSAIPNLFSFDPSDEPLDSFLVKPLLCGVTALTASVITNSALVFASWGAHRCKRTCYPNSEITTDYQGLHGLSRSHVCSIVNTNRIGGKSPFFFGAYSAAGSFGLVGVALLQKNAFLSALHNYQNSESSSIPIAEMTLLAASALPTLGMTAFYIKKCIELIKDLLQHNTLHNTGWHCVFNQPESREQEVQLLDSESLHPVYPPRPQRRNGY